jgi:hypothetical protein
MALETTPLHREGVEHKYSTTGKLAVRARAHRSDRCPTPIRLVFEKLAVGPG